ncbi:P-type ATPase [Pseudoroseomonas sp. WGS1072]|uniref:P-type ATPase n=1 Tax=Roseomonas sp. WGS1072 TaxID=3366816 RepID=UPI003BF241CF
MRATDNTIARIIRMVEEASASRAPTQRFIERFSTYWTPGAMVVSALVILVPPFLLGWDWWTSIYRGLRQNRHADGGPPEDDRRAPGAGDAGLGSAGLRRGRGAGILAPAGQGCHG